MQTLIRLDDEQRKTLENQLKVLNLQDYAGQVEMLIMGELTPADILHLLQCIGQSSYLRGMTKAMKITNTHLHSISDAKIV